MQNFTLISNLLKKICKQKSYRQKLCKIGVYLLLKFYTTYLLTFWQITFLVALFPNYIHGFEIRQKFCIFLILVCKKRKNIFGSLSIIHMWVFCGLLECRVARNGLTNWKTFLTNIFKNIIWHLFAGESHQVVKSLPPTAQGQSAIFLPYPPSTTHTLVGKKNF